MTAVEISNLVKSYGKVNALRDINLTVPKGTIYGLVGSNGAGKTTLIKTLVGITRPSSGMVRVLGHDPVTEKLAVRKKIGYMPQDTALYATLSVLDNINFVAKSRLVERLHEKVNNAIAITELGDRAGDPIYTLSGGMKKRVSLACALVHRPAILFLDEPTAAVDPQLRVRLWGLFRELSAAGTTVFVSTHLMAEAMLCDKITILNTGRVLQVDSPKNILRQGKTSLSVKADSEENTYLIDSTPEAVAERLHDFRLSKDVSSIAVQAETLEEIVVKIIESKSH